MTPPNTPIAPANIASETVPASVICPTTLSLSVSNPRLSPDRQWIAFDAARQGGPASVYVAPFSHRPIPEPEWRIVDRAASHPFWSADGPFLYYTPAGTNPLVRSAVRGKRLEATSG